MAGHSKWSKVKHITGPLEGKHGVPFGRRVKAFTLVARGSLAAGSVLYMFDENGAVAALRLLFNRAISGVPDDYDQTQNIYFNSDDHDDTLDRLTA